MDRLGIGSTNAYEIALKIDEAMWKTLKSDSDFTAQGKSEQKFLKLAERRKTGFKSKESAKRMRIRYLNTSGYPDAPFTHCSRYRTLQPFSC